MTNRTTLAQLREMPIDGVATLPVEHLVMLLEDVAEAKRDAALLDSRLSDAMALRYADKAAAARKAKGRTDGSITIADGDYAVTCDLPRRVEWDQDRLAAAVDVVRKWGENPTEYVKSILSVPEAKFNAWPQTIRDVFAPARTVGHGKASYKLAPAKKESGR